MKSLFLIFLILSLHWNFVLAQDNIIIRGTWENGPGSLILDYMDDAATARYIHLKSEVDPQTGKFKFIVPAKHPVMLQIFINFFLAFPGDTIEFVAEGAGMDVKLNFSGPNSKYYNFIPKLREEIGQFRVYLYSFDQDGLIEKYEKEATAHYDSVINFYLEYFSDIDGIHSRDILIRDLITISYYNNLLYPLSSHKITKDRLPGNYFEPIELSIMEKTELLPFREFILVLHYINDCIYSMPSPKEQWYDSVYVADNITSARKNFRGEIKDNLLLEIYCSLAEYGKENNKEQIGDLYSELSVTYKNDPSRLEKIQELKRQFGIVNKTFPAEIITQKLKATNGDIVSWGEVLSSQELIYVDFWASWCGPCLAEMPSERELISEFTEKGIKFIFISLDENEEKWKKAMNNIMVEGEHYIIPENFKSQLVRYISFNEIPRYLIIKENMLLNRDAPRPGFILKNKSIFQSLLK